MSLEGVWFASVWPQLFFTYTTSRQYILSPQLFMADSRQSAKNSYYTLDGSRCPLTEPIKDSELLQVPLATRDCRCCGPIQTAGGALAAICSRPTFGHGSLAVTVESTGSAWRSDCLCLQMRSGNLKLEQLSVLSDGFQQGPRFGQWPPAGAAGVRPLDTKMNQTSGKCVLTRSVTRMNRSSFKQN